MRKKHVNKMAYVLSAALLASAAGCGAPDSGQVREENPMAGAEGSEAAGSGAVSGGSGNPAVAVSLGTAGDSTGTEGGEAGGSAGTAGGPGNTGDTPESGSTAGDASASVHPAAGMVSDGGEAVTDFGLRLLRSCWEAKAAFPPYASMPREAYAQTGMGDNILVSPLSMVSALAMTANGAGGETLAQMEATMGMAAPELSAWLSAYREALPKSDKYKLSMANGIWFTEDERFTVEPAFLETNEEFFGAGVYRSPFDDSTLKEINGWVKENTDGMIEEILDEIPSDAVMYLVNALAFDAQWQEVYHDYQVREGTFTTEDGTAQEAEMMYSTENAYLEGGQAEGFLKYYADGKYAFAALLPEEGLTLQEYLSTLDGAKLRGILENPIRAQVDAAIPKYESEYSIETSKVLQSLGMADAFDISLADFSGLGHSKAGNLYISGVLHKTYIAVDERGTKAGAATAVEIKDRSAAIVELEVMTVHLDRPFLYMLIDCESNVPVFIGTVGTVA